MIALSAIPATAIRDVWPLVKPGLDKMLEQYKDRWIPEDVYLALSTGAAFLYLIDIEQETHGFMVLKNFADTDGLALFVWVIYADPQMLKQEDRYEEILSQLDELARKVGAKRIRHYSHRGGWTAKKMFKLKMHIYEREV